MGKNDYVYLDYQASTPICEAALREMQPFLAEEYANPHSSQHIAGIKSLQAVEAAKSEIAKFINADSNEIIFTSGATEANNLALIGMCRADSKKKRILVSSIEHKCVLAPAEYLRSLGYEIEYIPVTSDGTVKLEEYKSMLDDDVYLISIMAVNNEVGSIQPIKECALLARSKGALFHTDAAQASVFFKLDAQEMCLDLVSLSSHKMYGPKGVGALYVSNELQSKIQPLIWGGGQQNGIRAGTLPTHLCVGFGAAAKYLRMNRENIVTQIRNKRDYFFEQLQKRINSIQLVGPALEDRHAGNANIAFDQLDAGLLLGMLQTDVAASTGSACTSGIIEPSHVLSAMGIKPDVIDSCIRFSFGADLETDQIDLAIQKICHAVEAVH
ncbi:cysteine desulfurase family protein [Kordiimonas aquimaris]|uniref:cysteine desulfurase family protein n=1 Tax=Kordiimonas aquimaris TaxID=707591 RepID=UPI0021D0BF48|nr:cysteine desulfurase family protein [Kordiimonas aquimaris]